MRKDFLVMNGMLCAEWIHHVIRKDFDKTAGSLAFYAPQRLGKEMLIEFRMIYSMKMDIIRLIDMYVFSSLTSALAYFADSIP